MSWLFLNIDQLVKLLLRNRVVTRFIFESRVCTLFVTASCWFRFVVLTWWVRLQSLVLWLILILETTGAWNQCFYINLLRSILSVNNLLRSNTFETVSLDQAFVFSLFLRWLLLRRTFFSFSLISLMVMLIFASNVGEGTVFALLQTRGYKQNTSRALFVEEEHTRVVTVATELLRAGRFLLFFANVLRLARLQAFT